MDVYKAVRTVLAVRKYQSKPVPADVVKKIAEAGHLSASASNKQPWHFIFVDNPDTLKKMGSMARTGPYIAQAPLAVVVVMEKNPFAESDASRAVQNMVLTAWSEGVGSNWVGFHGLDDLKPLLGIPAELDVFAVLPMGYPADKLGAGKKNRKPFDEVVYHGKYGGKFS